MTDDDSFNSYYPVISDFFTVYHGNSFLIGRISNDELRGRIIRTYTLMKGLIDSYRMNNELVQKLEYSNKLFEETQSEAHRNHVLAHEKILIEYAKSLKDIHGDVKVVVPILLGQLRESGVLSTS